MTLKEETLFPFIDQDENESFETEEEPEEDLNEETEEAGDPEEPGAEE